MDFFSDDTNPNGHAEPSRNGHGPERRKIAVTRAPLAIVGIGCRFPGGSNGPEAFWRMLRDGVDAITDIPEDRWNIESFFDPEPNQPGKTNTPMGRVRRWCRSVRRPLLRHFAARGRAHGSAAADVAGSGVRGARRRRTAARALGGTGCRRVDGHIELGLQYDPVRLSGPYFYRRAHQYGLHAQHRRQSHFLLLQFQGPERRCRYGLFVGTAGRPPCVPEPLE